MRFHLNNKGMGHHHFTMVLLALVGVWFLYHSYKQNHLQQDMADMLSDITTISNKLVTSPQDRMLIDQRVGEIRAIMDKYQAVQSKGLLR